MLGSFNYAPVALEVSATRDPSGLICVAFCHDGMIVDNEPLDLDNLSKAVETLADNLKNMRTTKDREFAEYALTLATLYSIGYRESAKRFDDAAQTKMGLGNLKRLGTLQSKTEKLFAQNFLDKKAAADALMIRRARLIGQLEHR